MIRFLYCWTSIFQISIDLYCDKCFLFFPFPKPIRRLSPPPSLFFPLSKDPRYNSVKKKRGLNPSKLRDIREIEIDSCRGNPRPCTLGIVGWRGFSATRDSLYTSHGITRPQATGELTRGNCRKVKLTLDDWVSWSDQHADTIFKTSQTIVGKSI